ncbi:MAG: hypothetical protein M1330_01220 [Armatimonadetes bacterium]|nr:hypothetical protein [Armatimonadota bacterium]
MKRSTIATFFIQHPLCFQGAFNCIRITALSIGILITSKIALAGVAAPKQISNGLVSVRAIADQHGSWTGFQVISHRGAIAATVGLSSIRLIEAKHCRIGKASLRFVGLKSNPSDMIEFSTEDAITVKLIKGSAYPEIAFRLNLVHFNAQRWQQAAGAQPFHFLALFMPRAEVWQQEVWLNATPYVDKFPLLKDVHVGTPEISAYHYNRTWSYTPPFGAFSIPVIGLWNPSDGHYAGYEFETTRLKDNSEKYVAAGYHWQPSSGSMLGGLHGQFVALVYPYGGHGYQSLIFPKSGAVIESHGRLLWSMNLKATGDPSRLLWGFLWRHYRNLLPRVPARDNLSWLPGEIQLKSFPGPATTQLYGGPEGTFQVPGSLLPGGWGWYLESPTSVAISTGDTATLKALEAEAKRLLAYAKHFKSGNEECVYWEKPLKGNWAPEWGGPAATTIHNANGFAFGRLYLSLYRYAGQKQYLPIIDGIFNWAKNIAWTRAEFSDVPSSPFAIGGTLPTAFCLAYYMAFRNAPDRYHRIQAKEALDLARTFVYRYMIIWPSDNNRDDDLHPEFLWGGGNSGRDWMGAGTSNEVFNNLDTLAQTAVETGDPILMWALQGSLNTWHQMYQDVYRPSIAQYRNTDMAEGFGLFPGNIYGVGRYSSYGFSIPLCMIDPVGKSRLRVLAGCHAAMAFDKDGVASSISDYHYSPDGNLSFIVHTSLPAVDVSLTVPYENIHHQPVAIVYHGRKTLLTPGKEYRRPKINLWSLYIPDLHNGAEVIVGHPDERTKQLPVHPPLLQKMPVTKMQEGGFETIALPSNAAEIASWQDLSSWAGVPGGLIWTWGVPFAFPPADNLRAVAGNTVMLPKPISGPTTLYLAFSAGNGQRPSFMLSKGRGVPVNQNLESMVWHGWPPIFHRQILMAPVTIAGGERVTGINPGNRVVWALTAQKLTTIANRIETILVSAHQSYLTGLHQQQALNALHQVVMSIPAGSFAILPTSFNQTNIGSDNILVKAGLPDQGVMLTPDQLVDPAQFNAKRFPAAVDLDEENYKQTVHRPRDAVEALKRFLAGGGILLFIGQGPYPMAYGNGPNGYHDHQLLPPQFGFPLYNSIETLPQQPPTFHGTPEAVKSLGLPVTLPYPLGDPRLRSVSRSDIPANIRYVPLYTVSGPDGKSYGDAAGMIRLPSGGRIIYFWGGLLRDAQRDAPIAEAIIRHFLRGR